MQRATFVGETRSGSLRGELAPSSIPISAVDIPYVTELPKTARDGEIVVFQADAASGVNWTLRYRRNGSPDYPWESIAADDYWGADAATRNITATSYAVVPSTAISIPVVLPGVYHVTHTAWLVPPGGGTGNFCLASFSETSSPSDNESIIQYGTGAANGHRYTAVDTVTLGVGTLQPFARVDSGTGSYLRARLGLRPARVGRP